MKKLPEWRFETLNCKPEDVPDRMREAAAFLHLSRYEGNSIVCNEAMAMNLPCLFTKVGLMNDGEPLDVSIVESEAVYGKKDHWLRRSVNFSMVSASVNTAHAIGPCKTLHLTRTNAWREVMVEFGERFDLKDLASLA